MTRKRHSSRNNEFPSNTNLTQAVFDNNPSSGMMQRDQPALAVVQFGFWPVDLFVMGDSAPHHGGQMRVGPRPVIFVLDSCRIIS